MQFRLSIDPMSSRAVQAALDGVKAGVQNVVLKGGVGKAARQGAKQAKQAIKPGPTGAYKASIGTKFKSYKSRTVWVFVIGPRKNMARPNPRPFKKGKTFDFDPARYGHLVEGGRKSVRPTMAAMMRFHPRPKGNKLVFTTRPVRAVPGKRQIENQYIWLRSGAAFKIIESECLRLFAQVAARYAAKGKSIY